MRSVYLSFICLNFDCYKRRVYFLIYSKFYFTGWNYVYGKIWCSLSDMFVKIRILILSYETCKVLFIKIIDKLVLIYGEIYDHLNCFVYVGCITLQRRPRHIIRKKKTLTQGTSNLIQLDIDFCWPIT